MVNRSWLCLTLAVGLVASLAARADWLSFKGPRYPAPVALAAASDTLVYTAEYGAREVAEVDLAAGKVLRRFSLPLPPSGLALDAARSLLYVTGEAPEGRVMVVDLKNGRVKAGFAAGHTPLSPVLDAQGKTLYVCNRFNNDVGVLDAMTGAELARVPVAREPVAAALSPDGKWLAVANHLPAMRANGDYVAAVVSLVDTVARTVVTNVTLPNGSTGLRGICISPDGRYVYATHTLGRYQLPTTQLERGWMNTSALSIIDLAGRRLVTSVLLDDVDLGAANPWGVACSTDGVYLCVAHAGTHEISVIRRQALHEKLDALAAGNKSGISATLADVPNDLSFLVGIRHRVRLPGNGPRGLVVAGLRAVAAEYFSDEVVAVRLDAETPVQAVTLAPKKIQPSVQRKGEMYFNDAQFCFQQWQSCASCHPDGRADALNWDLLNDGIGNPKNTRSMLFAHRISPVMSMGVRDTAEMAVRSGLKYIQFAVRPEEDAAAIDAYLKSLAPVPSPWLVRGRLSAAGERGRTLFKKVGCADCHSGPLFTDMKPHDVGTGEGMDRDKPFTTARLVEVWRTAPYLHNGSALTVEEAFRICGGNRTAHLSAAEVNDLRTYVLSQ